MPSRKKQKPSYSVPEDLHETPQTGWVYRSEEPGSAGDAAAAPVEEACVAAASESAPHHPEAREEKKRETSSMTADIIDLTAKTITSGIATMGNAVLLGARLVSAPFVMGMRWMGLGSR